MIQLQITMTGKSFSPKDEFSIIGDELKSFADMKTAKDWLRENYGKAKRAPMYVDTKDGQAKKIGYVIGFRNADQDQHWIQQDWIEFREVKTVTP